MARDIDALLGFLAERQTMPFAWGRRANDCVSFAIAAIDAVSGRRLLPRVDWHDEATAAAAIDAAGGIDAAVSRRLRPIAPAAAMRGDLAAVEDPRFGLMLMVVEGATLAGPGARGVKRLPRSAMVKAWNTDV